MIDLQKHVDEKKQVFIEDLTPEQKAQYFKDIIGKALPVGLINCGNTCYVNSSM